MEQHTNYEYILACKQVYITAALVPRKLEYSYPYIRDPIATDFV